MKTIRIYAMLALAGLLTLALVLFIVNIAPLADMKPLETGGVGGTSIYALKNKRNNVYAFYAGDGYALIDAGSDKAAVQEALKKLSIDPADVRYILLTHTDSDHVASLGSFPDATIYMSEDEAQMLDGSVKRNLWGFNALPEAVDVTDIILLTDGQELALGERSIRCIKAPGHTPGSMVFFVDQEYLFTGDAVKLYDKSLSIHPFTMDKEYAEHSLDQIEDLFKNRRYLFTAHYGYTKAAMSNDPGAFSWRENELEDARDVLPTPFAQDSQPQYDGLSITNAAYFPIDETVTVDLDGDGNDDTVSVYRITTGNHWANTVLQINEHSVMLYLDNPVQTYALIDINTADPQIQVFLCEEGPSYDPRSTIYSFDGGEIIASGNISGIAVPDETRIPGISDMMIDGSGFVTVWKRAENLQTWYHQATYSINEHFILYEITPDAGYYPTNYPVFMLKSLNVYKSNDTSSEITIIGAAQEARITATDNNHWIQVTAADGMQGWVYLENPFGHIVNGDVLDAPADVFSQLTFAD